MKIHINGHHFEVTDALKQLAKEKVERLLERRPGSDITHVDLTFLVENLTQITKIAIHLPDGNNINASADSEDIYKSLDLVLDKAKILLNKHKDKVSEHR